VNRKDAEVAKHSQRFEPSVELNSLAHQVIGTAIEVHWLDLLVDETLVVELKAVEELAPIHVAQILSYLKATRLHLGLLISFNVTLLRRGIRRVIYTP
jgi:GxxExxY protein